VGGEESKLSLKSKQEITVLYLLVYSMHVFYRMKWRMIVDDELLRT
jgi:hypothetical protein